MIKDLQKAIFVGDAADGASYLSSCFLNWKEGEWLARMSELDVLAHHSPLLDASSSIKRGGEERWWWRQLACAIYFQIHHVTKKPAQEIQTPKRTLYCLFNLQVNLLGMLGLDLNPNPRVKEKLLCFTQCFKIHVVWLDQNNCGFWERKIIKQNCTPERKRSWIRTNTVFFSCEVSLAVFRGSAGRERKACLPPGPSYCNRYSYYSRTWR